MSYKKAMWKMVNFISIQRQDSNSQRFTQLLLDI